MLFPIDVDAAEGAKTPVKSSSVIVDQPSTSHLAQTLLTSGAPQAPQMPSFSFSVEGEHPVDMAPAATRSPYVDDLSSDTASGEDISAKGVILSEMCSQKHKDSRSKKKKRKKKYASRRLLCRIVNPPVDFQKA